MGFLELFLIAVGLSMDAFAVSLCKGLNMRVFNRKYAVIVALFFGGFQALMPFLGWLLAKQFAQYITEFDHWIAFILLAFIGGKMVFEAVRESGDNEQRKPEGLDIKELLILSVATSIDALAAGITFAFLQTDILPAVSFIGLTTFVLSLIGVIIGNKFGVKFKSKAELAGGIVLILLGLKILLEHINLLPF